jgi:iron complex transport system substrate-binding protein
VAISERRSGPRRIASLAPSNTDIALALGLGDRLVGVDDWSSLPEGAGRIERLGGDITIDLAKLKELRPDLVLCSLSVPGMEPIVDAVRDLRFEHIVLDPERYEDVYKSIFAIGMATGAEDPALEVMDRMRVQTEDIARTVLEVEEIPRVYFEWWPNPLITPGRRSWVTDMIEMAGGRNVFAEMDSRSSPVVDDEVLSRRPEVIAACWCGTLEKKMTVEKVAKRKGWDILEAIRDSRVHLLPESLFGRPGPQLVNGLRMLRNALHPEAKDRPPSRLPLQAV